MGQAVEEASLSFHFVYVVVMGSFITVHLAYLFRVLLRRSLDTWRRVKIRLGSFRRSLRAAVAKQRSDEKVDEIVAAKIQQARLSLADGSFKALACVLLPGACIVGAGVYSGAEGAMTRQQDIVFLTAYATVVIRLVCPGIVTLRTLSFWYCYCMILLTAFTTPIMDECREKILMHSMHGQVLTTLVSMGNFQFRVSLFWNAVHDAAQVVAYSYADACHLPEEVASVEEFCEQTLYCFAEKAFLYYLVEMLLVSSVRREVEATKERSIRFACASLLRMICDSVVELDTDHRIVEHVPALAHTLLHAGGKSFRGMMLQDFIPDEADRQSLEQSFSQVEGGEMGSAAMFHTRMKDSLGNRIHMQCFHVAFTSLGSMHHLIGIREDFQAHMGQHPPERAAAEVHGIGAKELEPIVELAQADPPKAGLPSCDASVGEASEASVASDMASECEAPEAAPQDVGSSGSASMVRVDVYSWVAHLPIAAASRHFQREFGSAPKGSDLLAWLPEKSDLCDWISMHADDLYEGRLPSGMFKYGNSLVGKGGARKTPRRTPRLYEVSVWFPEPFVKHRRGVKLPRERYRVGVCLMPLPDQRPGPPAPPVSMSAGTAAAGGERGSVAACSEEPHTTTAL